jgi:hypothetical protein
MQLFYTPRSHYSRRVFSEGAPSYLGFHLTALWDHLVLYGVVGLDCPRLRERVAACSALPFVGATRPV